MGDARTVVLSPHFDDAALSVGGLILRRRRPLMIVTVHGGAPDPGSNLSEWDARCGFVSAAEAYAYRRVEDARACALLDAEQVPLPNADGPYREPAPFDGLAELLRSVTPDTEVFVPLGTNQPDHAAVRDAALALLGDHPRVTVYADLPYTVAVRGWGTEAVVDELAADPVVGAAYRALRAGRSRASAERVALDEGEWCRKRDAVLCYASQLCPVTTMSEIREVGHLLGYPGPLGAELVWSLGPVSRPRAEGLSRP